MSPWVRVSLCLLCHTVHMRLEVTTEKIFFSVNLSRHFDAYLYPTQLLHVVVVQFRKCGWLQIAKAKFKAFPSIRWIKPPIYKNSCLKTNKNSKQNFIKLTHSCRFTSFCNWNRFTWIHLISMLFASHNQWHCRPLYAALPVWQPIRLTHADRHWFICKDLKIPKLMWEFIKSSAVISCELLLTASLIYTKNFQPSQNLRAFSILMLTDS